MSQDSTEWFRANGFYGGAMTTMRQKSIRTVYYNQIEGDLAHCSVFDMHNNILILDEAVINGGRYKISRYGEYIFLDNQSTSIDTRQTDTYSRMKSIINEPPPSPEASCEECDKPADMVLLIDNSKSVIDDYQLHDEYVKTAANFVDLWFKPRYTTSSGVRSTALICRFSNRLQVDAKMVISDQSKDITYYDYGNAHGPRKFPPHYDFLVNKTPNLSLTTAKDKLSERLDATSLYGEPLPVGEERWAWRGDETNMIARRTRAENGEGTGSMFFYSMLGDLNDFVKYNQFLVPNKKSFLFVLTDATYIHDDPREWKEDDLRACENREPDYFFKYPYELSKNDVCEIFRGLARSFRKGF